MSELAGETGVVDLAPHDEHNALLISHAHPADWRNPTPAGRYNLVAIGGGTAGIVSALATAGLGGRAAIVERNLLGGDCLNFGCVPSKALIRSARAAYQSRTAERHGCRITGEASVDFPAVMDRLRRLRARIGEHDSAARLTREGVDVFLGQAVFTGPDTVQVAGQTLSFARAVIATGGRAAVPTVAGLAETGFLTNETVFSLTVLPRRLIVIGGGSIGCELAQAFGRFGGQVHLVELADSLLANEDPRAAEVIRRQLESERLHLHLGWKPAFAEKTGEFKSLVIERGAERRKLIADEILVAAGRRPNVDDLGLEAAGVRYSAAGVEVDDRLRTSNRRIFAAGDVCTTQHFTHAADAMARICVQNALFLGRKRFSRLVIPRTTYTDPEVAHVGLTPAEAAEQGVSIDSYHVPLADVDRAVIDGEQEGFAVVHTTRDGRVVGGTIVAAHAGEMIGELTLLMTRRLPLSALGETIHCYPTQVEALKRIADLHRRARLTPRVARWLTRWLAWRR